MGTAADVNRPWRGIISARRAPRDPREQGPHVRGGDRRFSRLSIKRLLVSDRGLSRTDSLGRLGAIPFGHPCIKAC